MVCLSKVAGCEAELARRNIICAARDHRVTAADHVVGAPADGRVLSVRLDRVVAAAGDGGASASRLTRAAGRSSARTGIRTHLNAISVPAAENAIVYVGFDHVPVAAADECSITIGANGVKKSASNARVRTAARIAAPSCNGAILPIHRVAISPANRAVMGIDAVRKIFSIDIKPAAS